MFRLSLVALLLLIPGLSPAQEEKLSRNEILALDSLSWELQPTDIDSGLALALRACRAAETSGDSALLCQTLRTAGSASVKKGRYEQGVNFYIRAKNLGERMNDPNQLAKIYTGLAVIYKRTEKYDLALEYNKKALGSDLATGDSSGIAADFNNIGIVLRYLLRPQEALGYFEKAVALRQRLGESRKLPGTYSNMANALCDLGRHADAVAVYRKALAGRTPAPSDDLLMANMASCMQHLGDPKSALASLDTALNLARTNNSLYSLLIVHQYLADAYEKTGDLKNALTHYKLYREFGDSLKKEDAAQKLAELQEQYESARKDRDIAELAKANLGLQLDQANTERIAWITGLTAAAVVFFGLFLFQRRSRILRAQRDEALIQEKERGLKITLEAVEAERSRIARDLHDGIAQQLAALKLSWQKIMNDLRTGVSADKEMSASLLVLDAAGKEVRSLSHTIMPPALKHHGLAAALSDLTEKTFSGTEIEAGFDDFTGGVTIPENTAIQVYRMAQELLANIVRHSRASRAQVQLLLREGRLVLRVEDNGTGFDFAAAKGGIGLTNLQNRSSVLGGDLRCESEKGKGTTFIVRIPL